MEDHRRQCSTHHAVRRSRRRSPRFDFVGKTLAEWQKLGNDKHSLIAAPEFVAPNKFDFTLEPN